MVDFRRSVVEVLGPHGEILGAGFALAGGFFLTAARPRLDGPPVPEVEGEFEVIDLDAGSGGPEYSVAAPAQPGRRSAAVARPPAAAAPGVLLLQAGRLSQAPPLVLAETAPPGRSVLLYGFPPGGTDARQVAAVTGELIGGRLPVPGAGAGFIGSPVVDADTGQVLGVLVDAGLACPAQDLRLAYPELAGPDLFATRLRNARRLNAVLAGVLAVALAGGGLTLARLRQADDRNAQALSRLLTAESRTLTGDDPLRQLLVAGALESALTPQSVAAARALLTRPTFSLAGHRGTVNDVAFSPDGKMMATAGADATVQLWNPATRHRVLPPATEPGDVHGDVTAVAFSPDGRQLASAEVDGTLRIRDTATLRQLGPAIAVPGQSPVNSTLTDITYSADGAQLATAGYDGAVRLWSVRTRRQIGKPILDGSFDAVARVAFSPVGHRLVAAGRDGTAWLRGFDAAGHPIGPGRPLTGRQGSLEAVAFSPDGAMIATAGFDGSARLWSTRTRRPLGAAMTGHAGPVNAVAFSPDGATLATAGQDGTVRLWSVKDQSPLLGGPLGASGNPVQAVEFSPQGRLLAGVGVGGTIRLWDVAGRLAGPDSTTPDPTGPTPIVDPDRAAHRADADLAAALCSAAGRDVTEEEWATYAPGVRYRRLCRSQVS